MTHHLNKISSLIILITLFPLMLIISLIIILNSRGPIIHWSKRIGKQNKIFLMPKFRTMISTAPQIATHLIKDSDNLITWSGAYLRKSSLDEIPQLYSIIKGDMNFIGPRPALFNQFELIDLRTKNELSDFSEDSEKALKMLERNIEKSLEYQYIKKNLKN